MRLNFSIVIYIAIIIEIFLIETNTKFIRKFKHKRKQPKRFKLDKKTSLTCSINDKYILSFDKMIIDLVTDNCKYDLVSTDCFGQDLPAELVPFSIRVRQQYEYDIGCYDLPKTKFLPPRIKYVEVFTYDNSFKMFRYDKNDKNMVVNVYGISVVLPYYYGNDITVLEDSYTTGQGGLMKFNTSYGLNVIWDGEKTIGISLGSNYAGFVCGLCGNADGNINNDIKFRYSPSMNLEKFKPNKEFYFDWSKSWRAFDDSSDINQERCKV